MGDGAGSRSVACLQFIFELGEAVPCRQLEKPIKLIECHRSSRAFTLVEHNELASIIALREQPIGVDEAGPTSLGEARIAARSWSSLGSEFT